ncbi:hypothetical protein DdX_02789 [Ditylenchus destructor]|uniref:Uncharacterized protein n=1 Tax=Ditylenchus destructor TaxID=166010 RepID=A0AAD4RC88_9BILA|nr:hypothetical protein DdX_02789 [Ditylenchus destructor]
MYHHSRMILFLIIFVELTAAIPAEPCSGWPTVFPQPVYTTCPPNEDFSCCSGHCQPTCDQWHKSYECWVNACVKGFHAPQPGCVCTQGKLRKYPGGPCVDCDSVVQPKFKNRQ